MILAFATLAALLRTCAPAVSADTMRAIVAVESHGYSYAISDNTSGVAYCVPGARVYPCSREQANAIAATATAHGHSIDVGLSQVNSGNFRSYKVTVADMLEPCANLRIGSTILANAYRNSTENFSDPRKALLHAIMAYNTGSLYAGVSYVQAVVELAFADAGPTVPSIAILGASEPALRRATPIKAAIRNAGTAGKTGHKANPKSAPLLAVGIGCSKCNGLPDTLKAVVSR